MKISVNNISKSFGSKKALDDISFTASSGRPFGLLGRNGAGKTTCMRIIMNVFEPDEGEVLLDGEPLRGSGARLGYLPEERGLYRKMRVGEQLEYFGQLRGLSAQQAKKAVGGWLKRLELTDVYKSKVETLSKGNQQRIQLALAFINDPDIVILDEPFSGLDPVNAGQLRDIAARMAAEGKLIIFSSHQMSLVENFCEDVLILRRGRNVMSGSLAQIRASWPDREIRIAAADTERAERVAAMYGTVEKVHGELLLRLRGTDGGVDNTHAEQDRIDTSRRLLEQLVAEGAGVYAFEMKEPTLEQIFVECASDGEEDGE